MEQMQNWIYFIFSCNVDKYECTTFFVCFDVVFVLLVTSLTNLFG